MPWSNSFASGVDGSCCDVGDVHGRALDGAAAEIGFADPDPPLAQRGRCGPRVMPICGLGDEHLLGGVEFVDHALVGLRELHGAADDGGKHGFQVERGIDGAQHLLERLQFGDRMRVSSAVRSCTASNRRAFSMAMTA